jgi:hypothetical protein
MALMVITASITVGEMISRKKMRSYGHRKAIPGMATS